MARRSSVRRPLIRRSRSQRKRWCLAWDGFRILGGLGMSNVRICMCGRMAGTVGFVDFVCDG
jgi:hypothetical protein